MNHHIGSNQVVMLMLQGTLSSPQLHLWYLSCFSIEDLGTKPSIGVGEPDWCSAHHDGCNNALLPPLTPLCGWCCPPLVSVKFLILLFSWPLLYANFWVFEAKRVLCGDPSQDDAGKRAQDSSSRFMSATEVIVDYWRRDRNGGNERRNAFEWVNAFQSDWCAYTTGRVQRMQEAPGRLRDKILTFSSVLKYSEKTIEKDL